MQITDITLPETFFTFFGVLLSSFEKTLAQEIHAVVSRAPVEAMAYCLALNYGDNPGQTCIPTLGLGLLKSGESIRLPKGPVKPQEEHLWNPAEFSTLSDPALQPQSEKLASLDQRLAAASRADAGIDLRALCNWVAQRLNRIKWAPLAVSPKFIVYAVDDDLADLNKNLAFARKRAG